MNLNLNKQAVTSYRSLSQKVRVLTEGWVDSYIFCPSCGRDVKSYPHNKPVADFYCPKCSEDFELKSKKDYFGKKIVDGAYRTMMERLQGDTNPNLFLLSYHLTKYKVTNFFVVPKHFFVPQIIEKRKPLSSAARRAGWTGCNILINSVPLSGRIFYIRDKKIESKKSVLGNWKKTLFLRESRTDKLKGWILDTMKCIDRLNKKEFSLQEMYGFEKDLKLKYPNNKHIKDKIRQQLQFLRNKGYLEFRGKGKYKLI